MESHSKEVRISEIDECSFNDPPVQNNTKQISLRTNRLFSSFSGINVPQLFRRKQSKPNSAESKTIITTDNNNPEKSDLRRTVNTRPKSVYFEKSSYASARNRQSYISNAEQIAGETNESLWEKLAATQYQLLESERHVSNLEMRLETLESELQNVQQENHKLHQQNQSQSTIIRELERRQQNFEALEKEQSLNQRIREMELASEVVILNQKLGDLEMRKVEKKVEKIMEDQGRFVEQTLPYTEGDKMGSSLESVYDHEDGLFNSVVLEEYMKDQNIPMKSNSTDSNNGTPTFISPDDYLITGNEK